MKLYEKDIKIQNLKNVIDNRNKLLRKNYKYINDCVKINPYLNNIIKDYKNYYTNIKAQKQKQLEHLNMLFDYINKTSQNNNLPKYEIEQDKKNVLKEIKKIKKEIDHL